MKGFNRNSPIYFLVCLKARRLWCSLQSWGLYDLHVF